MLIRLACALLLPLLLAGCAASSVLTPYPAQALHYRNALDAGTPAAALARIGRKTASADATLYLLEKGRVAQLAGAADASREAFAAVIDRLAQQDERAVISASSYAASGASLLTNDNARPYQGRVYERVFVHQYQALNYLAAGDLQGALVEVRRANQLQTEALRAQEGRVDKAQAEAAAKGLDTARYDAYFSAMELAAGRVKSGFQNAATFYLSGLIYEAGGLPNDAYIDYRKALELVPANTFLQKDVLRTGLAAGIDEIRMLAKQHGTLQGGPRPGEGELVVYLEEGFVPAKQPVAIPIWTTTTLNHVSFPLYGEARAPAPMVLQVDGQEVETGPLVDTRALAVRTLKDETPALLARAFLRLLTRQQMQRQARSHDSSGLLGLASTLYSLVTEQPDLRSWLTLPGSGQVLRLALPAGEHSLSRPGMPPLSITVRPGRPTLVHLVALPGKTYSRIYPL
ncbi:MAG: COG3014 family protein [Pseudomonadota bacterium]